MWFPHKITAFEWYTTVVELTIPEFVLVRDLAFVQNLFVMENIVLFL